MPFPPRISPLSRFVGPKVYAHFRPFAAHQTDSPASNDQLTLASNDQLTLSYHQLVAAGTLQRDTQQATLIQLLSRLNDSLRQNKKHKGVYIHGRVGSGKTAMMDLFHQHVEVPSHRVHFHQFLIDVHQRMHKLRKTTRGPLLEGVARGLVHDMRASFPNGTSRFSVVCIDEMALSDIADAVILKSLFASLFAHNVVIVATSNRLPSQLYEAGLNRPMIVPFLHKLENECIVFSMQEHDKDYRVEKTMCERTRCFFPPSIRTPRFSTPTYAATLEIPGFGRSIIVSESEFGIHADFQTIVDDKWGTADMTTLAKHLSSTSGTFHLTNVRPFATSTYFDQHPGSSDEYASLDDAKRFITLIDILYEARVPIMIQSTGTSPQDLFSRVSHSHNPSKPEFEQAVGTVVKGEGGSSSSHATTFYSENGNVMEWSATGRKDASLAGTGDDTPGARDARFAVQRSLSRLAEMGSIEYNTV